MGESREPSAYCLPQRHFPARRCRRAFYGLKPTGSGGASRISVMVTRRLAAICGSSGNSGWLSALPPP
jgi:hypothetical protein